MSQNLKDTLRVFLYLAPLIAVISYCGIQHWKLDEATFYKGPQFELKLTRYYENYPLHFTGKVFHVLCASNATRRDDLPGVLEHGWKEIASGVAFDSTSAKVLVDQRRSNYIIVNETTLVVVEQDVLISSDACGSFHSWSPSILPREMIEPAQKPPNCAPLGQADCSYYDLLIGERKPIYTDVLVAADGTISFSVHSLAFKNKQVVYVQTQDFGKTWKTEIR